MTAPARHHGSALAAVVGAVTLLHAWLGDSLLGHLAALQPAARPDRLQADFVAEVRLQAPPAPPVMAAPPPLPVRRAARPQPLPEAASAPEPALAPESEASAPDTPSPASAAAAGADDADSASGAEPDGPAADTVAQAASEVEPTAPHNAAAAPLSGAKDGQAAASAAPRSTAVASEAAATTAMAPAAPADGPGAEPSAQAADGELLFGFPWPRSTRIRYALSGQYRGEVRGSAEVVWLRDGTRYQVHVDTMVGPSFAPLFQRNISSDGRITPDGLAPQRYDEQSKIAFSRRHRHVTLGEEEVVFTNGERQPRWPGVQDLASQFVQLTFQFLRDPALLTPGRTIELPVAMSKKQMVLVFDVLGEERLPTRLGELPAVHLRPRMPPGSAGKLGGDLLVELWFAPQLEYLPVRVKVVKDESAFVDMVIDRLPQRAAPAAKAASAAAS